MTDERKCPHNDVQFCPLYVAAHEAGLPTCIVGDWANGCSIERGKDDYCQLVADLFRAAPKLVATCAEAQSRIASEQQIRRNMRAAALH